MSEPTFDLPELSENLVTIIAPLGDEPNVDDGLSAQQLRNKFDEGGKNIRNFLNNTLSPAIKNFLRSLNTAISNANTAISNANTAISNLSNTLTSDYRTASAQDEIDASLQSAVANKADSSYLCYVITGAASPPTSIQAGSYIILKDSTISGCPDGLYTAAQAIPASTLIDATYLTAVSGGGLNDLNRILKSFIKVNNLTISNSDLSSGRSITANVSSGYKFLEWLPTGASWGWVATFPIYLENPLYQTTKIYYNGTVPSGSDKAVLFSFLEILDL